jgi:chondroitin AC lyase
VQDLETNNGSFGSNDLYTWTPAEKAESTKLDKNWLKAINNVGGLGFAHYDKKGILDAPMLDRVKNALYDAFTKLGNVLPIDTQDYMSESDFEALDNQWLKEIPAAGFADSSVIGKRGWKFSHTTHQWEYSDALTLPAAEISAFLHQDALSLDPQVVNRAQQAIDGMHRSMSTNFALHINRLALGDPDARWGDILDTNHSSGVWVDANMHHRSRFWISMLWSFQDYNRPITYLPYWYKGFNFTRYPQLWGQGGGDFVADQTRFQKMKGFTLFPGWSPSGVFTDVRSIVLKGFPRKKKYDLSGYQPDGFINHHHGGCPDTAMTAYGFEWLTGMIDIASILRGTRWSLEEEAGWLDIPARVILYTYSRIVYKGYVDFAFTGRNYFSDSHWDFGKRKLEPVVFELLNHLSGGLSADMQQALHTMQAHLLAATDAVTSGNTAFWNSDSMVMRERSASGMTWYTSLRMRSLFSHGNEDFETVAKSWHTGSGMMLTRVFGDEYDMVRAKMDWHVLPGVTDEWRSDKLPKKGKPRRCGGNTFAATLSDGRLGVAAFEYIHHPEPSAEIEANDYSTAEANKAYFFRTWGIVAVGNSVRRATYADGSLKRGQNKSIVTTIDQARWRGNVTIGVQRASPSQGNEQELLLFGNGSCHRDLEVEAGALAWVHQGAVGYVVRAPENESVNISIRCGTAVNTTDPDEASNPKWGEDRRWQAGSGFEDSDLPFLVLIDHGFNPSNSSYVYAVVPGVNSSDLQGSILAEVAKALSSTSILRNDANVQALVGGSSGGGGNTSVVQVVFRSSTEAQLPLGRGGSLVSVTSNRPAVAIFTLSSSHWNLSIAEATRDGAAKTLQVSIKDNPLLVSGRYNYRLPGLEPMDAVDDVVVSSSTSGSTDIVIGLPDMADDEAYGYRAEMFLSVPISVQIPTSSVDEEAVIAAARDRWTYLFANSSATGSDAALDSDLVKLSEVWHQGFSFGSILKAYGCEDTGAFADAAGCFSENNRSLDFWDYNDAKVLRTELYYLHNLAFKYVSGDFGGFTSTQTRDFVVAGLRRLVERGLIEAKSDPGLYDGHWDTQGTLYFAWKDNTYRPGYSQVMFATRFEGMFGKILMLLREELKTEGIFDDLMGALRAMTRRWGHGQKWLEDTHWFTFGENTDQGRVLLTDRLHYVLALDDAGDSDGTRAQHMEAFKQWAERLFIQDTTVHYCFKPDGTLHHHQMIYANGYPYDILPWASFAAYILADTPWALSRDAVDNIARASRVLQMLSAGTSTPRSVGGRLVSADRKMITAPRAACVAPVLASLPLNAISEEWRIASAASTWKWTRSLPSDFFTDFAANAAPHFMHHGCLRLLHTVRATFNETFSSAEDKARGFANSLAIFSYAGMAVFRPGGGQVVAVAKGFGREVKNPYERNLGNGENYWGQYMGAGSLLIASNDKSVDPVESMESQGKYPAPYAGFDWYHMPGVTAPYRTSSSVQATELASPHVCSGSGASAVTCPTSHGVYPRIYPGSSAPRRYSYWAEDPDAFVGGVSVGSDKPGLLGVWGFRMEDPLNNQTDITAYLDEALVAYKTHFFFAGGEGGVGAPEPFILSLGSDISGKEQLRSGPVQTTLFQDHLGSDPAQHPITVNGAVIAAEYNSGAALEGLPLVRLRDAAGNGYVLVRRPGTNIRVSRGAQTTKRHGSFTGNETRNYSLAWLEHNMAHASPPSYEYAVLLNSSEAVVNAFNPEARYKVLTCTKTLHAVSCRRSGQVALLFFTATNTTNEVINLTHLTAASTPCALLLQPQQERKEELGLVFQTMVVTFANPALGFLKEGERFNAPTNAEQYARWMQRSTVQNTTLTMQGHWWISENASHVPSLASPSRQYGEFGVAAAFDPFTNSTRVRIRVKDGLSIRFVLGRNSTLSPSTTPAAIAYKLEPTRDFVPHAACAETRTWLELRQLSKQDRATGGLGGLMTQEFQVWYAIKGHSCNAAMGASDADWMVYIFSELSFSFRPWGFNSELQLF